IKSHHLFEQTVSAVGSLQICNPVFVFYDHEEGTGRSCSGGTVLTLQDLSLPLDVTGRMCCADNVTVLFIPPPKSSFHGKCFTFLMTCCAFL
uniref:Uncharacterized protein n=1 Tax=Apteryx owenii TaxID=8824 RepID=A0A8B9PX67_APTOW